MSISIQRALLGAVMATAFTGLAAAADVDAAAAQALIKKSGCGTCHAVDKDKDGPSYKTTAAKYKGNAAAEDDLYKHLTTGPKGHKKAASTNEADVRNLARYILAQ